jgi:hypothetical protein
MSIWLMVNNLEGARVVLESVQLQTVCGVDHTAALGNLPTLHSAAEWKRGSYQSMPSGMP